jgi:hypothetical protein
MSTLLNALAIVMILPQTHPIVFIIPAMEVNWFFIIIGATWECPGVDRNMMGEGDFVSDCWGIRAIVLVACLHAS